MATTVWVGEPVIIESDDEIRIEQDVLIGTTRAWESFRVEHDGEGGVSIGMRGEGDVQIPAHLIPIVIAAMQKLAQPRQLV